tara:strand:+ start:730 stop:945 length:216 start_codon:yes stop_codon:yes gene_type:complete
MDGTQRMKHLLSLSLGKLAIAKAFHNLTLLSSREESVKSLVSLKENVLAELVSIVEIEVKEEQSKMLLGKN